jgi:hypothetical protein
VYGVVVYTGAETKVGKNKTKPPVKWTKAGERERERERETKNG